MKINVILEKGGILPSKQTPGAAAYDLYVPADFKVKEGRQIIPLAFRIAIPVGYEGHIQPRSGYSAKGMEGVLYADSETLSRFQCDVREGKIDSDYRGVVGVIIHNHDVPFFIKAKTRIAQFTIRKVEEAEFNVVDELEETERGEGGFGHTNE